MLTNPLNNRVQPTQTIGALNRLTVVLGHGYAQTCLQTSLHNSVPLFAPSLTLEWNLDRTAPVLAALQNTLGEG